MQSPLTKIPIQTNRVLWLLAVVAAGLVLAVTSRYGAGLSPDSVRYISAARSLLAGQGLTTYEGGPLVVQPPLFPAFLALSGKISATDPAQAARFFNAVVFGLSVYLAGRLSFRLLGHQSGLLPVVATLGFIFSAALFRNGLMVLSEPLFIFWILAGLIYAHRYLQNQALIDLSLGAAAVGLACLTRYIGIALIAWGLWIVLLAPKSSLKQRLVQAGWFALIAGLPSGLWLVRNLMVSGTISGPRGPSAFSLLQNLELTFNSLVAWYIPTKFAAQPVLVIGIAGLLATLAGLSLKRGWPGVQNSLERLLPEILFVLVYTTALVIASTVTAYDPIGTRLLSPIFVPLTLILVGLVVALLEPLRILFSGRAVHTGLIIGLSIWLIYPIGVSTTISSQMLRSGIGFSGKAWSESETIQYLQQHPALTSTCPIYSNAPDAVYILANLPAHRSPAKTLYASPAILIELSSLKGAWPAEPKICLVWFDPIDRPFLFSLPELQAVTRSELIASLSDGQIFSIVKQPLP